MSINKDIDHLQQKTAAHIEEVAQYIVEYAVAQSIPIDEAARLIIDQLCSLQL